MDALPAPNQPRNYSSLNAEPFARAYFPEDNLPKDYRTYGIDPNHQFANNGNYNQSVNALAQMFPNTNDPLDLLPRNYLAGDLARRGKDLPLSDTERYADVPQALTAEEQARVDEYKKARRYATNPYADIVLSDTRPAEELLPLSRTQKKMQSKAARRRRDSALSEAYLGRPQDRYAAEDLYERDRKIRSMERELRDKQYFDPQTGTLQPITENYRIQQRALQNIHRRLPASITKPEYMTYLQNPNIQGSRYAINGVDQSRAGYTLQTLPISERNEQLWNLFKMVGVLNAAPVYDPRLTSVESAERVYSPDDYWIFVWDGDKNVLTPGTVVILTREERLNGKGEIVPAGSPVAIGGWTLSDATEKKSLEQLKTMLYYEQYPSSKDRRLAKRSDFVGAYFGSKELTSTPRGLKLIAQFIRMHLISKQSFLPQKRRIASGSRKGSFIDVPAFIALNTYVRPDKQKYRTIVSSFLDSGVRDEALRDVLAFEQNNAIPDDTHISNTRAKIVAFFKMGTPVFNTFISWVAKLFFNMYICTDPVFPFRIQPDKAPVFRTTAQSALAHGILGEEIQNITYKVRDEDPRNRHYLIETDEPATYTNTWGPMPTAHGSSIELKRNIHEYWNKSYFDETALNIILRDEDVSKFLDDYIKSLSQSTVRSNHVSDAIKEMMHVILYHTMNAGLENYVDDIVGESVTQNNYKNMFRRYLYAYETSINFCNAAQCQKLAEISKQNDSLQVDEFKLNSINTVTKKQWANIITECKLSRRGYTWVGRSVNSNPADKLTVATADYYTTDYNPLNDLRERMYAAQENPLVQHDLYTGLPASQSSAEQLAAFKQRMNDTAQTAKQSREEQLNDIRRGMGLAPVQNGVAALPPLLGPNTSAVPTFSTTAPAGAFLHPPPLGRQPQPTTTSTASTAQAEEEAAQEIDDAIRNLEEKVAP